MNFYLADIIRERIKNLGKSEFTIFDLNFDEKTDKYSYEAYMKVLPAALKRFRDNNEIRIVFLANGERKQFKQDGSWAVVMEVVQLKKGRPRYAIKKQKPLPRDKHPILYPVYVKPPEPAWAKYWKGCWEIFLENDFRRWRERNCGLYSR